MNMARKADPETPDDRLEKIASVITVHEDFPIRGVRFRNVLPVLRHPDLFSLLIDVSVERIEQEFSEQIDVIVGLEARGFLFGPSIAHKLNCAFACIRKPGKLPGKVASIEYKKEYGMDKFEIEADAIGRGQRVLIVDDVLATGGTVAAAAELVQKVGGNLLGSFILLELSYLNARKSIPATHKCVCLYVFDD